MCDLDNSLIFFLGFTGPLLSTKVKIEKQGIKKKLALGEFTLMKHWSVLLIFLDF